MDDHVTGLFVVELTMLDNPLKATEGRQRAGVLLQSANRH